MRDWTDLRELYENQRLTSLQIAQIKGVKFPTVLYHMRRQGIKTRPRNWRRMKHVNFQPSPFLSYVMGALYGDGWVSKSKLGRIEMRVISKEFADKVAEGLNFLGLNAHVRGPITPPNPKHNQVWIAMAKSQSFCRWWHETDPFRRLEISLYFPTNFIQGLFDAEGSVYVRAGEVGPRVSIACGRLEVMSAAMGILKDRGYNCTSEVTVTPHGTAVYQIKIGSHSHAERFVQEFPSTIVRNLGFPV